MTFVSGIWSDRVRTLVRTGYSALWGPRLVFTTACSFRAFLQKQLPAHLNAALHPDPLKGIALPELKALPAEILRRWPPVKWKDWQRDHPQTDVYVGAGGPLGKANMMRATP